VFSRLVLERQGARLSSAYEVVDREILHRSPILLTPYYEVAGRRNASSESYYEVAGRRNASSESYSAATEIDTAALEAFFSRAYADAGVARDDVDTGALIVTGNAANKENAHAIADLFAAEAGRFVCATAGPHLEALLAAHGSGAVARSRGRTLLGVDIGGGTTKLAVVRDGRVVATAALAIGARLVAFGPDGAVSQIEDGARLVAKRAGIVLRLGAPVDRPALADALADALASVLESGRFEGLARELLVTEEIELPRVDVLIVSGGVAEYVYGRESADFGDLGPLLGTAIGERLARTGMPPLERGDEGIRATVIGAGQYTVQLSGSTVFLSRPDLLPLRDLAVTRLAFDGESASGVAAAVSGVLERLRRDRGERPVALALSARIEPSYTRLRELAAGIAEGTAGLSLEQPLVLVFDTDLGRSVGAILHEELLPERAIIAIDEVRLSDFDYIDVGSEVERDGAVPVVVKTLVFHTAPGG